MRRKQEDNVHITMQHKDFLKMSTSRADTVSFRSWVSHSRYESGFPLRNSNYINNTKFLHMITTSKDKSQLQDTSNAQHKSLTRRSVRFPVTDSRNQQQQKNEDWWQFVMARRRPVVTVQDIVPDVKTEPSILNKYRENRFQKKVFREGLTCKMFKDNDKILYFRNSGDDRKEGISVTKKVDTVCTVGVKRVHAGRHKEKSFVHDDTGGFPRSTSFIRTNNRAILHPRAFYLKTPSTKPGQSEIGATPNCKCRLCLLESERMLVEKLDKEDDIMNSIDMRLNNRNPDDIWSSTSSCPPSRPNSLVGVQNELSMISIP